MNVTILQWNVWYREKAANVLGFLRETGADIVCLQELTEDSHINPGIDLPSEIANLGYEYHYEVTLERSGDEFIRMGNGIFSKFPITSRRAVYVQHADNSPETVDKENRLYLEASLSVGDKQLVIGNAHLSYTRGFIESPQKTRETDLLLEVLSGQPARFIFTCDANAVPGSTTIKRISERLQNAGPDFAENTWTTKRHEFTNIVVDGLKWRLDYVFATPDIKVVSSKTLATDYSDHLPILTGVML